MILLFETDFDFLRERKDKNWQLDRRAKETFANLLTNFVKFGLVKSGARRAPPMQPSDAGRE
jgi:hypothetical protein